MADLQNFVVHLQQHFQNLCYKCGIFILPKLQEGKNVNYEFF